MSQHVAFYQVLTDPGIELKQPQGDLDTALTFTPPPNAATDNPAILSFMVGFINANNLKFRINLNGNLVVALILKMELAVVLFARKSWGLSSPASRTN